MQIARAFAGAEVGGTRAAGGGGARSGKRPRRAEAEACEVPYVELQRRAADALSRVEVFLGVEIEEAKEIVSRVIEDVP